MEEIQELKGRGKAKYNSKMLRNLLTHYQAKLENHEAKFENHEAKFENLQSMETDIFLVRRFILEGGEDENIVLGFDMGNPALRSRLNEVACGGNLFVDCQVLSQMRQTGGETLPKCEETFQKMYSVDLDLVWPLLRTTDIAIKRLYDARANVRVLRTWTNAVGDKKRTALDVKGKCDEAIQRWEVWASQGEPKTVTEPNVDDVAEAVWAMMNAF